MWRAPVATVLALALMVGVARAAVPADPLAASWTYEAVSLPQAWELTTGSPAVVIAVVDSGIDEAHPDLAGSVVPGYDFVDEDSDAGDVAGHGTAVSGILGARANNGLGGVGVCWSCRLMPLRVLGPDGFALYATQARAIDYAVDHGAAVVNVSLYGEDRNPALEASIHRARAAGVLVVAAAGNEGWSTREYGAAFPEAISVGATVESGRLADYSNRGDWVKLAAPACVPTTYLGDGFGPGCGTSGATPVVAGIVALARARAPFSSASQIEAALERTARPVAGVQFGLVDAFAALQALGEPSARLEPSIVGHPATGRTLEAFSGIWSGAGLDVAYRWERCRDACEPVGSRQAYVVAPGDEGARFRVIASAPDVAGATSALTALVPIPPRNVAPPSVLGRVTVGSTLTGSRGSWSGTSLTFTSHWMRCRDDACRHRAWAGYGARYRLRDADRGHALRFVVTATNEAGTATASSARTRRAR
jgi:subtilisin family serine protease